MLGMSKNIILHKGMSPIKPNEIRAKPDGLDYNEIIRVIFKQNDIHLFMKKIKKKKNKQTI